MIRELSLMLAGIALALALAHLNDREFAYAQSANSVSSMGAVRISSDASTSREAWPLHAVEQLQQAIRRIIDQPQFETTRWGILVESLNSKRALFSHEANHLFIPASNMKLFVTAAALADFGPDYRFKTSVYAAARPDAQGVLHGDIILYGRGDPNLSSHSTGDGTLTSLDDLADQLYRAGVRDIRGNVIGDESYFSDPPLGVGWEWDDVQWSYGAEISALSINDNVVELTILPGEAPGQPAKVFTLPETSYVTIENKVATAQRGSRQDIGIYRGLESNTIEVWGQVPPDGEGFHGQVSVHRPALYAATLFTQALARRGIKITGGTSRADAKYRRDHPVDFSRLLELAFVESIPLDEEVRILNKTSQNLHAELLLRALGAVTGKEGTASKGTAAVHRLLQSAQARRRGVTLQDGSGLSRHNLVTPATIVDLLRYMYQHRQKQAFLDSLPVAGQDGTLERHLLRTPAQGNVKAKSGTLNYTSALSGYVTTPSGEPLAFSIMANNHTGSTGETAQAIHQICVLLSQFGAR